MDFKKLFNLTGKKIVDILIVAVVLFAILAGLFYAAGMITFTFDTNDLMMMGVAFAVAFVVALLLNKFFGQSGGAPAAPGAAPAQPQPAPQPQQPAPAQ